jgi:hypothetical protein
VTRRGTQAPPSAVRRGVARVSEPEGRQGAAAWQQEAWRNGDGGGSEVTWRRVS